MRRIMLLTAAALSAGLMAPTFVHAVGGVPSGGEDNALVMVITRWDSGSCSGSTRSQWDNMLDAWYDELTNALPAPLGHGSTRAWGRDGFYKNGNRVDSEFCDPDEVSWGNDDANDNADEPDALMIGLHGGHMSAGQWFGRVRVDESTGGNCDVNQSHMVLGDLDLEFLHLSSCHSMCQQNSFDEWEESFDGLHQIDGFHGLMWIGSSLVDDYDDFAEDAFDVSIADAWIDNHYIRNVSGSHDQCPVALAAGRGEGSVDTRISNSEYDWVYDDPEPPTWFARMYVAGCDPKSEPALPSE